METLREKFEEAGLPGNKVPLWFSQLLRDGFALQAAGTFRTFREVAKSSLEVLLPQEKSGILERILAGFAALKPHVDVVEAFELARTRRIRIFLLSNGSVETTTQLLHNNRLESFVEGVLSIEGVRQWKPARAVYDYAVRTAGCAAGEAALVAAHAWDVHGAAEAGLMTGWVARHERKFSPAMNVPTVQGGSLAEVVRKLSGG